jgi:hypothetical protein
MNFALEPGKIKWVLFKNVIDTPGFSFQPRGPFELGYGHVTPFEQVCRKRRKSHFVAFDGKNAV